MTPDLYIFDCDGTLVDTEMMHAQGGARLLERLGVTHISAREIHQRYAGGTVSEMLRDLEYRLNMTMPDDAVDQLLQARHDLTRDVGIPATPGAAELLQALRALPNLSMAVASNGYRSEVLGSLVSSGLMPFFQEDRVFTKDMVARPKPAPDLFLHACAVCGVLPENALVIEDSTTGVHAAVAAGIPVIGYIGTAHDPESQAARLRAAGATRIILQLGEIIG